MYIGERDIGETIRILRTERGISREELAERVGISRSHLNKIEADIKRPSIITYQKIMDVLDADISINDEADRKSTRLNSSHMSESRMPSSA